MKNFILTMTMTAFLISLVSLLDYRPTETAYGGTGMKYKGDSGLIVPGGGELVAEVSFTPMQAEKQESEPPEKTESNQATKQATSDKTSEETQAINEATQESSEEINKEHKEEHKKVDITFWCGVLAVVIGEALALLVALAWSKLR